MSTKIKFNRIFRIALLGIVLILIVTSCTNESSKIQVPDTDIYLEKAYQVAVDTKEELDRIYNIYIEHGDSISSDLYYSLYGTSYENTFWSNRTTTMAELTEKMKEYVVAYNANHDEYLSQLIELYNDLSDFSDYLPVITASTSISTHSFYDSLGIYNERESFLSDYEEFIKCCEELSNKSN